VLLYNTHIRKLESDNVLWRHSNSGFIATTAAAAVAEYSANREHRKRYRCRGGIGRRSREQRESNAWEFVKGPALAVKLRLVLNCDLLTMAKIFIGVRSSSSSSSFYLPNNKTICTSTSIQFRRAGQQGSTRTVTVTGYIFYHMNKTLQTNKKTRKIDFFQWCSKKFKDVKFTVDGSTFQTFITVSTKNCCLMLAVHLGLNSLYLWPLVSVVWPKWLKWQEAQLSPSDRAMRLVSSNFASCHATVQKLLIQQVLTKLMAWSWRFSRRQCVMNNVH